MGKKGSLRFSTLRELNVDRNVRCFQPLHEEILWTLGDWVMAVTGELGEAANLLKKVRRGDFPLDHVRDEIAEELADVIIYLDLLAAECGIDLDQAVCQKFNKVSIRETIQYPVLMMLED